MTGKGLIFFGMPVKNILDSIWLRIRTVLIFAAVALVILFAVTTVEALRNAVLSSPGPSLLLFDRNGRFLSRTESAPGAGHGYWPVKKIPERLVAATLALEDKRFRSHPGFDPLAIARAAWQNISSGRRISGASTITMQVARLQNPRPRTYYRKSVEALTAVFLTIRYGRDRILKHYLTIVPYGNNCRGVRYAARYYLDKPAEDLSWAEIACLAAIPQSPGRMNPFTANGRKRILRRGRRILDELHEKDVIPAHEYELAADRLSKLRLPDRPRRPRFALHAILNLENRFKQEPNPSERVVTSLDLDLQKTVSNLAKRYLNGWRSEGADNVAAVVLRRETSELLAYVGSSDYYSPNGGAVDYARLRRSPGSALKPFIYALALELGVIAPNTILDDMPSESRGFNNADMRFLGPVTPRQALANSRNIPAISLLGMTGVDEVHFFLHRLGLHKNERGASHHGLSLAVGGMPVALEDLVRAYGALACDGILREIQYRRAETPASGKRVLSSASARLTALFLSDPMARLPSFPRMSATEYPFPAAVKTGTSQGYRNTWAVAWTSGYIVGAWTGRLDNRPMKEMTGSVGPAYLVRDILLHLHKNKADGLKDLAFPPPEGYEPVKICARSGKMSNGSCDLVFREWFPKGRTPEKDDWHGTCAVDTRNGLLAGSWTPEKWTAKKTFINPPPRYAEWARSCGMAFPPAAFSMLNMPENAPLEFPGFQALASIAVERPVKLKIDSPENGLRVMNNPETPPEMNSIALKVVTDPPVPQILWYVDGKPYKLADHPFAVRWPLRAGKHRFQARVPYREAKSDIVEITVE